MQTRLRFLYSGLVFILLVIPATQIYRELSRRSDIWWTPLPLASSLAESQDRVEIYARGKPLGALLEAGQVRIADQAGSTAAFGAALAILFVIATGRLAYRPEKEAVAA